MPVTLQRGRVLCQMAGCTYRDLADDVALRLSRSEGSASGGESEEGGAHVCGCVVVGGD